MQAISSSSVANRGTLLGVYAGKARALIGLWYDHAARIVRANLDVVTLLWKWRPGISLARAAVLIPMVGAPFLMSWCTGQIVAAVRGGYRVQLLDYAPLGLAIALIASGALPLALKVIDRLIEYWAFSHVQQQQVTKVPDLDPVTYSDPDLKDKIQEVQERAVWRIMAFAQSQIMLARAIILTLIAGGMLLSVSAPMCLFVAAAMLPSMLLEGVHAYRRFQVDERQASWWRRFWEDRRHILDSRTLAYLQVFDAAHWFARRFAERIGAAIDEYNEAERRSINLRIGCMTVGMGAVVAAVFTLIRDCSAGSLSVAQFVFYLGALSLFGGSLAEIAGIIGQQFGQSMHVNGYQSLLALESRTHFPANGVQPPAGESGISVTMRNVHFGYPQGAGKTRREVVKGVSLHIPGGQKWALVGENGAGKSTMGSLLVRLVDPDHGEVLIGDVPARELDRRTLRRCVACLPQQIQHYNLTVEEFIALGCAGEPIDPERVRWAARQSGAAAFIEQYPHGYSQRLGRDFKHAEEPSGGQLQKLALASLLYMKAPVMVLDEPTAAIDPEAARDFWDTLFHETPGQTVLFSTHYFGAVRRADRIVVLDQGSVLAEGSHAELMQSCAVYRALFESQARDYQAEIVKP